MQDGGNDALSIHAHFCHGLGYRQWMIDVGFTRHPGLAFVGIGTEQIGSVYFANDFGLEVGFQQGAKVANQEPIWVGYIDGFRGRSDNCHIACKFRSSDVLGVTVCAFKRPRCIGAR